MNKLELFFYEVTSEFEERQITKTLFSGRKYSTEEFEEMCNGIIGDRNISSSEVADELCRKFGFEKVNITSYAVFHECADVRKMREEEE
jgi:hypothetical protein